MGAESAANGSSPHTARALARSGFAVERRDAADGATVLACFGELDLATLPALVDQSRRAEANRREIILDLRGLDFIDSRGVAMILALDQRVREAGGRLTIVRGPETVNRVFESTGLLDRLDFVEDPGADRVKAPPTTQSTDFRRNSCRFALLLLQQHGAPWTASGPLVLGMNSSSEAPHTRERSPAVTRRGLRTC